MIFRDFRANPKIARFCKILCWAPPNCDLQQANEQELQAFVEPSTYQNKKWQRKYDKQQYLFACNIPSPFSNKAVTLTSNPFMMLLPMLLSLWLVHGTHLAFGNRGLSTSSNAFFSTANVFSLCFTRTWHTLHHISFPLTSNTPGNCKTIEVEHELATMQHLRSTALGSYGAASVPFAFGFGLCFCICFRLNSCLIFR